MSTRYTISIGLPLFFSYIVPLCMVYIHNLCFNLHMKHLMVRCQIQGVPVSRYIVNYKVIEAVTRVNMAAKLLF